MTAGIYVWRGQRYIGATAVALAAGVAPSDVFYHLRQHGHLDNLGCGKGGNQAEITRRRFSRPVTVMGRNFPSRRAFADHVGVSPRTISWWLANGRHDEILAALMASDARRAA